MLINLKITTHDAMETKAVGERLGSSLLPADVVALSGELGTGKTVFVQGLAAGVGTDPEVLVTSPSFVILHEYPGRLPLYHFDFYRLGKREEVEELGYEEYFDGDGICAVEWADKFDGIYGPGTLWAKFTRTGETERTIELRPGEGLSGRWARMERTLKSER